MWRSTSILSYVLVTASVAYSEESPPLFREGLPPGTIATYGGDESVYLVLDESAKSPLAVPRIANPIRRARWIGEEEKPLPFKPLVGTWEIEFDPPTTKGPRIVVLETVGTPLAFDPKSPPVAKADADGRISFPAHFAVVHGEKLQYEPQPHKNTVGFWTNAKDWAEWRFEVKDPGPHVVRILQGCGKGQGGSRAAVGVGNQSLEFFVKDTGHFQNFEWRTLGELDLAAGEQRLELRALEKAKNAVMDCRAIELVPKEVFEREARKRE
jgi:hypothetical protein